MKTAVAFLLVALSCCFDSSAATKIKASCLTVVLQRDAPALLLKLHDLLCLYQQGKDENNEELYKRFLKELNITLKDAGCSLDEVLKTHGVLENVGDQAGKVADKVVFEILETADDLEITGQLLGAVCKLLGKTLLGLKESLAGLKIDNILPGLLG
ncbi:ranaspumin-like [Ascaphus truei]|uniref:ranaspumin-like n=1 Tax=Ascaphus truei TaxID=8439 RepID=UPI003F593C6E